MTAVFLALWVPWDFVHFREARRLNERQEQQYRGYVAALQKNARRNPDQQLFVWDYLPDGFGTAGVTGALECVYLTRNVTARNIDEQGADELIQKGDAAWLRWNRIFNRLDVVHYPHTLQPAPYVVMDSILPAGQLVAGWYRLEGNIRWTQPEATAVLYRPENARSFELVTCPTEPQIAKSGRIEVEILLDGRPFVGRDFTTPGCQTARWTVPGGTPGRVTVEFHTTPPYQYPPDRRVFGITVKAFGFVSP